jgi:glucose-1-phosphate thymidylyltransferase
MTRPVAILLAAGYGTRMGELVAETPKPLLPVAGKPVLDHLLEQLLELPGLGAVHTVSNARYLGAFEGWAAGWRERLPEGVELLVHDDGSHTPDDRRGAVGDLAFALRRIRERAGGEEMPGAVVAAGDNIFRCSLEPLWRSFRAGANAVLAMREDDPEKLRRTGVLELDDDRRVVRLHEKPEEPPSPWACPSIYGLQPTALARVGPYLAAGHPRDEIGRFVAHLVERERVVAVEVTGDRLHVGSPESYRRADEILRGE